MPADYIAEFATWQREAALLTTPQIHRVIRRIGIEARIRPETLERCTLKATAFNRELASRR